MDLTCSSTKIISTLNIKKLRTNKTGERKGDRKMKKLRWLMFGHMILGQIFYQLRIQATPPPPAPSPWCNHPPPPKKKTLILCIKSFPNIPLNQYQGGNYNPPPPPQSPLLPNLSRSDNHLCSSSPTKLNRRCNRPVASKIHRHYSISRNIFTPPPPPLVFWLFVLQIFCCPLWLLATVFVKISMW